MLDCNSDGCAVQHTPLMCSRHRVTHVDDGFVVMRRWRMQHKYEAQEATCATCLL